MQLAGRSSDSWLVEITDSSNSITERYPNQKAHIVSGDIILCLAHKDSGAGFLDDRPDEHLNFIVLMFWFAPTGVAALTYKGAVLWWLRVCDFLEYVLLLSLSLTKAPGPARDPGRWPCRSLRPLALRV